MSLGLECGPYDAIRDDSELVFAFSAMRGHSEETRKRVLNGFQLCWHPAPSLQKNKKINLCCLSLTAYGVLSQHPELVRHGTALPSH
jgi:hypothetical protein